MSMSWERFQAKCEAISNWPDDRFEVRWVTGGATGGNCWGASADQRVHAEPEEELDSLDKILEDVCPTISFMAYRKLMREVLETGTETQSEYYGNYYNYAYKRVYHRALYDALVAAGHI